MSFVLPRRAALLGAAATLAAPLAAPGAIAQERPIRIGEINSYSAQPAFLTPYRNAWTMAQDEVNAAGGVNGRRIETVFRDDAGKPEDAVRLYRPPEELIVWHHGTRVDLPDPFYALDWLLCEGGSEPRD